VPSRRGSFDDSSSDDERMHEVVNKLKTSTPKPSVPELPNPQRDVLAGMFETIVLAHPSLDFLRGDLAGGPLSTQPREVLRPVSTPPTDRPYVPDCPAGITPVTSR
jgi:hypothetical protein